MCVCIKSKGENKHIKGFRCWLGSLLDVRIVEDYMLRPLYFLFAFTFDVIIQ